MLSSPLLCNNTSFLSFSIITPTAHAFLILINWFEISSVSDRWNEVIIDEVRVYDRALTATEVEHNFLAETNTLAVNSTGKVAVSWGKIKR